MPSCQCPATYKHVSALARLCAALRQRFFVARQAHMYRTPPDTRKFASCWDIHDVLVLQITATIALVASRPATPT